MGVPDVGLDEYNHKMGVPEVRSAAYNHKMSVQEVGSIIKEWMID
jgi:hypothetical protein